jgi:SAM-dependent methyltransferase
MLEMKQRREAFDRDAKQYERVRPGYPDNLFRDVISLSNIPEKGKILEIGCGTGQATMPLARQGYSVHCIELGANLAAVTKKNLAQYPNAKVSIGSFEEYPLQADRYDLVISATAFHWIDPEIGYSKIAKILKREGAIALFWNHQVHTERSADFFRSVQSVYQRVVPEMAEKFPGLSHPDEMLFPVQNEIAQTGLFGEVTIRKYRWEMEYTSKTYIELLNTFSDHIVLSNETRTQLFEGIENHIETKFDGRILREYLSVLYLAHCTDD